MILRVYRKKKYGYRFFEGRVCFIARRFAVFRDRVARFFEFARFAIESSYTIAEQKYVADYLASTYFLKLSKIACQPPLCISRGFSFSGSNVSMTSVFPFLSLNSTVTFLPSPIT